MNTEPFASVTRFPTGISTLVLKRWGGRDRLCRDRDGSLSRLIVSNIF